MTVEDKWDTILKDIQDVASIGVNALEAWEVAEHPDHGDKKLKTMCKCGVTIAFKIGSIARRHYKEGTVPSLSHTCSNCKKTQDETTLKYKSIGS